MSTNFDAPGVSIEGRVAVRSIHELLFSLNIALTGVSAIVLGDGVFIPFVKLAGAINYGMGLKTAAGVGGYLAFFLYAMLITAGLFLLLRTLHSQLAVEYMLVYVAGFLAIIAAPACWFIITHTAGWYLLEVVLCLALPVGRIFRAWCATGIPLALVVLHFAFWGWQFWGYTHNVAELLLPMIGLSAYVAWSAYLGQEQRGMAYVPHARAPTQTPKY